MSTYRIKELKNFCLQTYTVALTLLTQSLHETLAESHLLMTLVVSLLADSVYRNPNRVRMSLGLPVFMIGAGAMIGTDREIAELFSQNRRFFLSLCVDLNYYCVRLGRFLDRSANLENESINEDDVIIATLEANPVAIEKMLGISKRGLVNIEAWKIRHGL